MLLAAPESGDRWIALGDAPLPTGAALDWAVRPDCGAVVVFTGTARDHAPGRTGVELLEYEAYESAALERLDAVATELCRRWPTVGRVALLHRTGVLAVGDAAVVVAVSAPHRAEAFEAARFGIDALKASVPIWKRETWADGSSWGLEAQHLIDATDVATAPIEGAA